MYRISISLVGLAPIEFERRLELWVVYQILNEPIKVNHKIESTSNNVRRRNSIAEEAADRAEQGRGERLFSRLGRRLRLLQVAGLL